ncbi:MAG: hypothetical protein ACM3JD_12895, partial [Rudaea sp.]
MHALICCIALVAGAGEPFDQWIAENRGDAALPDSVGARLSTAELKKLENAAPTTPYAGLTCGLRLDDGTIWAGSPGGLLCLEPAAKLWRLFHSRRWLP